MEFHEDPLEWHISASNNDIVLDSHDQISKIQDQVFLPKSDENHNLKRKLPRDVIQVRLAHGDSNSNLTLAVLVTVKLPDLHDQKLS